MNVYNFTRELVNGRYNIDNIDRKDDTGRSKTVAAEVKEKIPGRRFTLQCTATRATFNFSEELSPVEQAVLQTVVLDHKNNR